MSLLTFIVIYLVLSIVIGLGLGKILRRLEQTDAVHYCLS